MMLLRARCGAGFFAVVLALMLPVVSTPVAGQSYGTFEQQKLKTFDKEKFLFPADLRGRPLNILFLAMSDSQEKGEVQQEALLAWHAELETAGVFSDQALPYHFPVLEGVPFFVKGIVAGAIRDSYEGKVPLDQAGPIFVGDLSDFAGSARLTLDDQPTIVIADADGVPLQVFRGDVTPEGVAGIAGAVEALLAANGE